MMNDVQENASDTKTSDIDQAILDAADHLAAWWKDATDTQDLLKRIEAYQEVRGVKFL